MTGVAGRGGAGTGVAITDEVTATVLVAPCPTVARQNHTPAAKPPTAMTASTAHPSWLPGPGVAVSARVARGCECRPGTAPRSRSASARLSASRM
ncbi:MAG TPA: hypothetical protein VIM63_06835 [Rhodoferax sp.]